MGRAVWSRLWTQRWGYIFVLPAFLLFAGFVLVPFVNAISLGFHEFSQGTLVYRAFDNYRELFTSDIFLKSTANTMKYVLVLVPLEIGVSLFVATGIYRRSPSTIAILRSAFYLPVVIPGVCMALVWRWMYNPSYGVIASVLGLVGIRGVDLLGYPSTAIYALMAIIMMYGVGQPLVLYVAALNGIPQELTEAAEIDGASPRAKFWKITLPLLAPTTLYNVVIQTIAVIQVIEVVLLITGGGPSYSTSSLLYLVWDYGFHLGSLGHAAAVGNVMVIIVAILSLVQFRFLSSKVEY